MSSCTRTRAVAGLAETGAGCQGGEAGLVRKAIARCPTVAGTAQVELGRGHHGTAALVQVMQVVPVTPCHPELLQALARGP